MAINYELAKKQGPRLKAMLTRAGRDPAKVKAACIAAMDAWDAWGAWPDNWRTWERALGDSLPWNQAISLEDLQRRRSNPSGSWRDVSTTTSIIFRRDSGAGRISTIRHPRNNGLWQWSVIIDRNIVSSGDAKNNTHAKEWCDSTLNSWAEHRPNPASDGKCYVVVEFQDGTYKTTSLPAAIGNHLMEHSGRTWSVGQKKQRHSKNAVVDRWLTAKFLRPIKSWDWEASKDQERAGYKQNPFKGINGKLPPRGDNPCSHCGKPNGHYARCTNGRCDLCGKKHPGVICVPVGGRQVKRNPTKEPLTRIYVKFEDGTTKTCYVVGDYTGRGSMNQNIARQIELKFGKTPKVWRVLGLKTKSNPSLGLPGMPHTWIAPDGSRVSSGDKIEYFHKPGRVGRNKIAKVVRYLIFDDHVMTDGSQNGDYVDASNFIRVVRRGNQVL